MSVLRFSFLLLLAAACASAVVISESPKPKQKLRVLVHSPSLGFSHLQFNGKLADLLVDAGHEVDVFLPAWTPFEDRTGVVKANPIPFKATTETRYHTIEFFRDPFNARDIELNSERVVAYTNTTVQFCSDLVNHPTMLADMQRAKYDVFIAEMWDPCGWFVSDFLQIKRRIVTSAVALPDFVAYSLGIPVPRSYVPSVYASTADVPRLGWKERAMNMLIDIYHPFLLQRLTEELKGLFEKKFDVQLSFFDELIRTSSYVFVNVHAHFDHPRPITNKIQYIGGIAVPEPSLTHTPQMAAIFSRPAKGVILFSLGSMVDTQLMPMKMKVAFVNAFARFPQYSVVWKIHRTTNDSELFSRAPNVFTVDWIDQPTILADPRCSLFISHCGQNSAMEAGMNGVPVLALPIFSDQPFNSALLTRNQMALHQDVQNIDEEELVQKIARLLNEPHFKENAMKVSRKAEGRALQTG
ncbi:putative UDP-glucuronosyltransferase ugt-48 [Aphelenchoides fujianensis]|nr:putative UDP-glucuronosyltransferase ugt-48 [Aphelenchoides fujianensis]